MRKGIGKRGKYFRGKLKDVENSVIESLRSLGIEYHQTVKGEKWGPKIPVYEIERHEMDIYVLGSDRQSVYVAIQVRNPLEASKGREIERMIDSRIGVQRKEPGDSLVSFP
jgi:IS4 transposase